MRIVFEEHQYLSKDVEDILWEGAFKSVEGTISINYVGYYFNPKIRDCVFILPRVLLEDVRGEEQVFVRHVQDENGNDISEGFRPEALINPDACDGLGDAERKFIYEFSVWIYRALDVYRRSNADSSVILHEFVQIQGRGALAKCHTFLDVLLALIQFRRDNRDFFVFTARNRHSGFSRINWARTISKTPAFIQDGAPVYLRPVNRIREIDLDDELFVIFYSILDHLREEYGFPVDADTLFEPMPRAKFARYLRGYGAVRLRQIKFKYFSDKALKMWELCFAFFQRSQPITVNTSQKEYLLAKSFDRVFEAIIDELVGAREDEIPDELRRLKKQKDGKMVDHLYPYQGLTNNEDESRRVFYIGDSKYYKLGNNLGTESVYKQFTYARNVIQFNLELFLDVKMGNAKLRRKFPKLRDDVTEGYNVIPNFFISARMTDGLSYADNVTEASKPTRERISRQFENRLFDRDTLLLSHYDVNFLWVVSLYARNKPVQKRKWREKVRGVFRRNIQDMLERRYSFYVMTPRQVSGIVTENFLKENFQQLLGKVFTPYAENEDRSYYSLALQKPLAPPDGTEEGHAQKMARESANARMQEENDSVLSLLTGAFLIKKCHVGENPETALREMIARAETEQPREPLPTADQYLTRHFIQRYLNDCFLVGYCKDDAHFSWIHSRPNKNKRGSLYNVRVGRGVAGGVNTRLKLVRSPRFLILYNGQHCSDPWAVHVYRINGVRAYSNADIRQKLLYSTDSDYGYLCYGLDEEVSFGEIDIRRLISDIRREDGADFVLGEPHYRKGAEILPYLR